MSAMRPLFLTTSLAHGGAERHSITLMNRLAERGHECHAAYVKDDASQLGRIAIDGGIHCLGARRFLDLRALGRLAGLLEKLNPSVVVCANPYALMYASLASLKSGRRTPIAVTYHSTRLLGLRERVKMLIDRFFIRRADCLVFVSEKQRDYWLRRALGSRRIEAIHNGVDPARFRLEDHATSGRALRAELGFDDGDLVLGMVAVLRPEKNHVQMLSAVAQLRRAGIPARALLVGDGPTRGAIESAARSLGIEASVRIIGYLEDVRPHIAACDAVVLCSITEALSLAAIEAMAMSRPVVHSEVGGGAELVLPGYNGYLFPVGDTPALVRCLSMLADREHAALLGRNARGVVETKFSEKAMVLRYERLLDDLCQPSASACWPNPVRLQGDG